MVFSAADTASRDCTVKRATAPPASTTNCERWLIASTRPEVFSEVAFNCESACATCSMLSVISVSDEVVSRANDSSCVTRFWLPSRLSPMLVTAFSLRSTAEP